MRLRRDSDAGSSMAVSRNGHGLRSLDGETIQIWGDGEATKDYIYVEDIVKAVVSLMKKGFDQSVYNVSSGVGRSLVDIIESIGDIYGRQPKVEHLPPRLYDVKNVVLSSNKLQSRTGWKPAISFEDGLVRTIEWIKQTKKS